MTTGSTGSPPPPYTFTTKGSWAMRVWNGADGKYTGTFGKVKWNDYACEQESMSIVDVRVQFKCILPGGGTDTRILSGDPWRRYPTLPISSNEVLKALSSLLAKVKGHSFNAAVNLAQSRQVADMVSGNLGKLGRSMLALKRGDFSTAARQLGATPRSSNLRSKDVSGRWLELQYGWLPLLSDTYEASKAYESITKGPRCALFRESVTRRGEINYSGVGSESHVQPAFRNRRYTYEYVEQMSSARQLGLLDPLSVAWEIIPYSFVVDWFVPIGTYLSNLNQIPSLTGRWLVSEVVGVEGQPTWKWVGGSATYPFCGYHGASHRYQQLLIQPKFLRRAGYYTRYPLIGAPSVPLPKFDLSGLAHGKRIWNAISLAHQRFR